MSIRWYRSGARSVKQRSLHGAGSVRDGLRIGAQRLAFSAAFDPVNCLVGRKWRALRVEPVQHSQGALVHLSAADCSRIQLKHTPAVPVQVREPGGTFLARKGLGRAVAEDVWGSMESLGYWCAEGQHAFLQDPDMGI